MACLSVNPSIVPSSPPLLCISLILTPYKSIPYSNVTLEQDSCHVNNVFINGIRAYSLGVDWWLIVMKYRAASRSTQTYLRKGKKKLTPLFTNVGFFCNTPGNTALTGLLTQWTNPVTTTSLSVLHHLLGFWGATEAASNVISGTWKVASCYTNENRSKLDGRISHHDTHMQLMLPKNYTLEAWFWDSQDAFVTLADRKTVHIYAIYTYCDNCRKLYTKRSPYMLKRKWTNKNYHMASYWVMSVLLGNRKPWYKIIVN